MQPGFEMHEGRMRHKARYENKIAMKVFFYEENLKEEEKKLAERMTNEIAENLHQEKPQIQWFEDAWQIGEEK